MSQLASYPSAESRFIAPPSGPFPVFAPRLATWPLAGLYVVLVLILCLPSQGLTAPFLVWFGAPLIILLAQAQPRSVVPYGLAGLALSVVILTLLPGFDTSRIIYFAATETAAVALGLIAGRVVRKSLKPNGEPIWTSAAGSINLVLAAGVLPGLVYGGVALWQVMNGSLLDLTTGAAPGAPEPAILDAINDAWLVMPALFAPIIGAIILLPALFGPAAADRTRFREPLSPMIGIAVIGIVTGVCGLAMWQDFLSVLFLLFPVLMWIAARFSVRETGLVAGCLSILVAISLPHDGLLAQLLLDLPHERQLFLSQLVLLISVAAPVITALLLASIKTAQQSLNERNAELQGLLKALPYAFFQLDTEGRIKQCHLCDMEHEFLASLAQAGSALGSLLPTDSQPGFNAQMSAINEGGGKAVDVFELNTGDEISHFELTLTRALQNDYLVLIRDVSEHYRDKENLGRRASLLARSNTELEQFAYVASHDLQEPLRTVASFCELLQRRNGDKLDDDGRMFIEFAVDGSKRLQSMIKDLLAFSRVSTRGRPFAPVNSGDILDAAKRRLQRACEEHDVSIAYGSLPVVSADADQLGEIFYQLLDNAIKYRGEHQPHIQIEARETDADWEFSFMDNGIGFDPSFKERIFQIFQKLHTRDKYPGNGMGLALARKIIERHGGEICAQPRATGGTTISLRLPKDPSKFLLTDLTD